ncbi:hypothetical protein TIFTF001_023033 [Ficus carica]|uniref:Uncharacterized protein n=1 Tax=Ficus carica TaxID=3494 RepID=A0AA88AFG8_FICCA|nr:hypothetical protein TIFTF001_023033 [Ficus carica]
MVRGLVSKPVRLINPHTIMPCAMGGPTSEGRPMRVRPYGGFTDSSDLRTHHPNFLYGGEIRLMSLFRSSPWSKGIAL